eukprot:m51a1_g4983 hypothetical protein (1601) ;mRNA; f:67436-77150
MFMPEVFEVFTISWAKRSFLKQFKVQTTYLNRSDVVTTLLPLLPMLLLPLALLPVADALPTDGAEVAALCGLHGAGGSGSLWAADPCGWREPCSTALPGVTCSSGRVTHLKIAGALSGTLPESIGGLSALLLLNLNGNSLVGAIPSAISSLTSLTSLHVHTLLRAPRDLGTNGFSGTIPSAIGNLTNLSWLCLANNQLSGTLPQTIGDLVNLRMLAVNNMRLSGTIPSSVGNLASLEDLLVQHNSFSGPIPSEIGNLSHLKYLVLRNNSLSGEVSQFCTMDTRLSICLGNAGLCSSADCLMDTSCPLCCGLAEPFNSSGWGTCSSAVASGRFMLGELFYSYDTVGGVDHKMRIDWTTPPTTELILARERTRIINCSADLSESFVFVDQFPEFFVTTSDVPTGRTQETADLMITEYAKAGKGPVASLWVKRGTILGRIDLADGSTIEIRELKGRVTEDEFAVPQGFLSRQPQCVGPQDVVIVLDASGAVTQGQWEAVTSFALHFASVYRMSTHWDARIGLVLFNDTALVSLSPTSSAASVSNALQSVAPTGGPACVECGLEAATELLQSSTAAHKTVLLVAHEGCAGSLSALSAAVATAVAKLGAHVAVVGVGNARDADLEAMAAAGAATRRASYSALSEPLALAVVSEVCAPFPQNACGGSCGGYCSCNSTCSCTKCDERWTGPCAVAKCVPETGECAVVPVSCDDGDLCTRDFCNTHGCVHDPISCDDGSECTEDVCLGAAVGCGNVPTGCDDNDSCTVDSCSPNGTTCLHTPLACPTDLCHETDCFSELGCVIFDRCSSRRRCTIATCNASDGTCTKAERVCEPRNACETASCNESHGCVYVPLECDDGDVCTSDRCDPVAGCQHAANETCPCANTTCAQVTGCASNECDGATGRCVLVSMQCPTSACFVGECSNATEQCVLTPKCPGQACDMETGQCGARATTGCYSMDPCYVAEVRGIVCVLRPKCVSSGCHPSTCVNGECVSAGDTPCTAGPCIVGTCSQQPPYKCGSWTRQPSSDDDPCTAYSCGDGGDCARIPVNCSDGNPCTVDSCDPAAGCTHAPLCHDGDDCTDDVCLIDGTCVYPPRLCALPGAPETSCMSETCRNGSCSTDLIPGSAFDTCGVCYPRFAAPQNLCRPAVGATVAAVAIIAATVVAVTLTASLSAASAATATGTAVAATAAGVGAGAEAAQGAANGGAACAAAGAASASVPSGAIAGAVVGGGTAAVDVVVLGLLALRRIGKLKSRMSDIEGEKLGPLPAAAPPQRVPSLRDPLFSPALLPAAPDLRRREGLLPAGVGVEAALALVVYTPESQPHEQSVYYRMNRALRSRDTCDAGCWLPYAWHLTAAMRALPLVRARVYRGISCGVDEGAYAAGACVCWNGFTSSSLSRCVATEFLGDAGTLFELEVLRGRDIGALNQFGEAEVLLESGTSFLVDSVEHSAAAEAGPLVVRMHEVPSPCLLFAASEEAEQQQWQLQQLKTADSAESRQPRSPGDCGVPLSPGSAETSLLLSPRSAPLTPRSAPLSPGWPAQAVASAQEPQGPGDARVKSYNRAAAVQVPQGTAEELSATLLTSSPGSAPANTQGQLQTPGSRFSLMSL